MQGHVAPLLAAGSGAVDEPHPIDEREVWPAHPSPYLTHALHTEETKVGTLPFCSFFQMLELDSPVDVPTIAALDGICITSQAVLRNSLFRYGW